MPELSRRGFLRKSGAIAGTAAGLALPPVAHAEPSAPVRTPLARHDPRDIDVVSLARTMVRFDTSHSGEGGVTLPYARTLRSIWASAGVATTIIPTPKPDNVHFIARITGSGAREPLVLLCHSDVVHVEREKWEVDPFAAEIRDGYLWGRGIVDMKGANAAFMSSLLRLVREGARFDRDIVYIADCDEEGGPYNWRWLTRQHPELLRASAVLTEGGWILAHEDGRSPMLVSMSCLDRVFGLIRLTAEGTATHSSKPMPDSAIARLNRAMARLSQYQPDVVLTEINRRYFAALAESTRDEGFAHALRLLVCAHGDEELRRAGEVVVARSPYPWLHNALLRATIAYVLHHAGYQVNVVPSQATATLQLRFTPGGQRPSTVLAAIRDVLDDPGIRMTFVGFPGETEQQAVDRWEREWQTTASDTDTDVWAAWEKAARATYPGAPVVPAMFEAATSGYPWRANGVPVYGIYPYVVDNDSLTSMHGNNERLRVEALRQGADLLYRMFAQLTVH